MHPQTLRVYENKGLLAPARSAGNTRRYSDADLARLRRIQELTELGLNLAGVRLVMEMEETLAALRLRLERRE
jgi:MerR family transcriptional regulator/heat shock protein HspR